KWNEIADEFGGVENLTHQQAQACALKFLSQCFMEDGTPEDIELPLEIAEGTTYQYATVAALTLRYFGIPARYAEGYIITEEMASGYESGDTIAVDSSCARAWVEIYQDGIGWIPMDLTPGMSEIMENSENGNSQNGNGTSNKDITEKKEEEEKKEEQEQLEPTGGSMVRVLIKSVLTGLLIILLLLIIIFVVLIIRRRKLLKQKEKKFQNENRSDAVAWIYADIAVLLEKLGFNRGNGSMRMLIDPLKEKFGEDFAAQFERVSDLNDEAIFSSRIMDEEQRDTVLRFRRWTLRNLNSEVKWYKRMWLKWVLCLY
ncbi:MAG: transglutaminase domain-containing protein, partial [Clostridia bacterium]|nr:transglutaminase domain-containing protein [Clostridia bacterium]